MPHSWCQTVVFTVAKEESEGVWHSAERSMHPVSKGAVYDLNLGL